MSAVQIGTRIINRVAANLQALSPHRGADADFALKEHNLAEVLFAQRILYFTGQKFTDAQGDTPLITLHHETSSAAVKARSQKVSNIVINLPNLLRLTGSLIKVGGATVINSPMLLLAAILMLILDINELTKVDFEQPIPYVLKALWELRYTKPDVDTILNRTNLLLIADGIPVTDRARIGSCLDTLERCKCISSHYDGHFSIEESIRLDLDIVWPSIV